MSLISTKGMYGLAAMYELSLSKKDTPMQVKEISKNANIPKNYLEQLLGSLRKAELIVSIRGAHGGYKLAKSANAILIKDILEALEGSLSVCSNKVNNPVLELFYEESDRRLNLIFELSLASLDIFRQKLNEQIDYSI